MRKRQINAKAVTRRLHLPPMVRDYVEPVPLEAIFDPEAVEGQIDEGWADLRFEKHEFRHVELIGGELDGRMANVCEHAMLAIPDEPGLPTGECFHIEYDATSGEKRSALYQIVDDIVAVHIQTLRIPSGERVSPVGL